jgi:hypothetical protein
MSEETIIVPQEAPQEKATPASLIKIDSESQALAPADHTQLARFIDQMIKAKAIPRHLQNREQVLSAWNYAAQLNLPPQPSLRNIAVIEGTPSLFGDLPLALVQRHSDFMFYEEFNITEATERISYENKNLSAKPWGGVVRMQRKGMSAPQSFSFTLQDAERAGLLRRAKDGMPWQAYQPVMLIRRARIMAIRALFADAITGAAIAEDLGYAPDLIDVTPKGDSIDKAALLNNNFNQQDAHLAPSEDTQQ